jgi:hypothetical protein
MTIDTSLQLMSSKDPGLASEFAHWLAQSDQFSAFSENYEPKIKSKIQGAKTSDNLAGFQFELEMAYLMLKDGRFSVDYEPFGNKGGPDFSVTYKPDSTDFYLEATRILERDFHPQAQFEKWKSDVLRQVRLKTSTLACCVYIAEANDLLRMQERWKTNRCLLDRLIKHREDIVAHIINTACALEDRIDVGVTEFHSVPDFEQGEIWLEYHKPADNITSTLDCYFRSHPIFKKGNEYRKFERKWNKIGRQMVYGKTNVLAISTDSKAHNAFALREFIVDDINKRAAQDNLQREQLWSGILFRGAFVPIGSNELNCLWFSTNACDYPIPEEIRKALRELG